MFYSTDSCRSLLAAAEIRIDAADQHPQDVRSDDHGFGFAKVCRLLSDNERIGHREIGEGGESSQWLVRSGRPAVAAKRRLRRREDRTPDQAQVQSDARSASRDRSRVPLSAWQLARGSPVPSSQLARCGAGAAHLDLHGRHEGGLDLPRGGAAMQTTCSASSGCLPERAGCPLI